MLFIGKQKFLTGKLKSRLFQITSIRRKWKEKYSKVTRYGTQLLKGKTKSYLVYKVEEASSKDLMIVHKDQCQVKVV